MNITDVERTGIDTASLANIFTVSSSNISSVLLKLGTVKTDTSQPGRQYGIYFKGFVYPNLGSLPVKLKSFVATLNNTGNKADLKWTTSSEISVSHFVVEKSSDGVHFSDLMLVFAKGTESSETNYSVSDEILKEKSKVIYYKLRTVDNDGNTLLSDIRLIRLSNSNKKKYRAVNEFFANPFPKEADFFIY